MCEQYGYYKMAASYFFCYDPVKMGHIFDEMKNGGAYASSCNEWKVKYVRDLQTGYDNRFVLLLFIALSIVIISDILFYVIFLILAYDSKPDNKAVLPVSSSSYMITYTFENGCVATFRGMLSSCFRAKILPAKVMNWMVAVFSI